MRGVFVKARKASFGPARWSAIYRNRVIMARRSARSGETRVGFSRERPAECFEQSVYFKAGCDRAGGVCMQGARKRSRAEQPAKIKAANGASGFDRHACDGSKKSALLKNERENRRLIGIGARRKIGQSGLPGPALFLPNEFKNAVNFRPSHKTLYLSQYKGLRPLILLLMINAL